MIFVSTLVTSDDLLIVILGEYLNKLIEVHARRIGPTGLTNNLMTSTLQCFSAKGTMLILFIPLNNAGKVEWMPASCYYLYPRVKTKYTIFVLFSNLGNSCDCKFTKTFAPKTVGLV